MRGSDLRTNEAIPIRHSESAKLGADRSIKMRQWVVNSVESKANARIDFWFAVGLAVLSLLLIYAGNRAAADAVRRYGYNVDSGALEWMVAIVYLAPLALLFGFASLALSRRWWIGKYAHWLAVAAVVTLPFVDYMAIF